MAVHGLPVGCQPFEIQRQDPRREIGPRDLRQDEKAAIIGDQMEAVIVEHGGPADPAVAGPALQRRRLPAQQRQPLTAALRHIAQRSPHHPGEAQVMVLAHQGIPAGPLTGQNQPDDDVLKQGASREMRMERG
jgi:hypothetical protein